MKVIQDLYPSRTDPEPRIATRKDPVVHTDAEPDGNYLLPEQVDAYRRDGFFVVEDLFDRREIDALLGELASLSARDDVRNSETSITEPGSGAVRSIFAIHTWSDVFDQLARDPRLVEVARHLLGDDVYIHQSRANMKPGFRGKEFYWHSDFETWHMEDGMPRMRAVSCSIALTANHAFNGPLMLIPGSQNTFVSCVGRTPDDHYKQSLKRQEYGVPDEASLARLADEGGIAVPTGPAGTATFFECNTMHGSNGNITPFPRSNAFFVYNSMENRVGEPFSGTKPRPEFIAARENIRPL